ncbi:MAG TPA: shikimate kinase [Fimbriimonadaceae bacterium]|nr:shikimate kinase [Fimbriimonadaceae bacterium]HRJ32407.1 shikimate kinase [Fimbriimonadaceae bacterium]
MQLKTWILIGMMGAGKSTIGRELAVRSGRSFRDTDQMIQSRFGRSVARVFDLYGEAAFREHETSLLESLHPAKEVLATGGGIVLREENWVEMRRLGTTVYLDVEPEVLKQRLSKSKKPRPLLMVDQWESRFDALYAARQELYRKADLCVALGLDTPHETVTKLLLALGFEE